MSVRSLVWLGVRTPAFGDMVRFYRETLELPVLRESPSAVWFALADGTEIHVYAQHDDDHAFFGSGPVVGFLVDDFEATRNRMIKAGIEFIGEPQRDGDVVWNHYRGPDGNVYEIMQRGS